jgi:HD-GYP domain-containing protein (c-di-GMP phosphodiesterase class II)
VMNECAIKEPAVTYQLDKTGIWGEAVRQSRPIVVNDFQTSHPLKKGYPEGHAPLYKFLTVPVFNGNRIVAVAGVANKPTDYDESDARQLTLLMDSVWRMTEQKRAELALTETMERLRKALKETIQAISMTVEARDPYTAGHQRRVADLSAAMAAEMGLPLDAIEGMRMAGLIHDLGKILVPAEILNKASRLTEIEFNLVKTHSQSGYDILKGIEFPWPIARMVLEHHERVDGSGYPNGLTGDALLLESRILAVADVVESMASHRPYRPAIGLEPALEEIVRNRGVLYDPEAVDACVNVFRKGYMLPD